MEASSGMDTDANEIMDLEPEIFAFFDQGSNTFSHYLSNIAVTPCPPAAQMEMRPRPLPFCSNSFARVAMILGPVAANG